MVVTQTSHRHALPVSSQLPSRIAVLAAVVSLECETTVRPQLALATETVWGLQQRHQQRGTNRTDRRNLAQQLHGMMLAALDQQVASRLLTHRMQPIQLLIAPFDSETNSGFQDLGQPCGAMTCRVQNRPVSLHSSTEEGRYRETVNGRYNSGGFGLK